MRATAIVLVAILAIVPAAQALPGGGEGPVDGTCDESGYLLCVGANAGAQATCTWTTPTSVGCTYTRGDVWLAYSPIGLPGDATVRSGWTVETCLGGLCSITAHENPVETCAWVAGVLGCGGDGRNDGSLPAVELAMGQCYRVTVTSWVEADGRAVVGPSVLSSVSYQDDGEGGAQLCRVDDGRD